MRDAVSGAGAIALGNEAANKSRAEMFTHAISVKDSNADEAIHISPLKSISGTEKK